MSAKDDAPQVYNGVSEADVPSAKWGWSELTPKTLQIAGWVSVAFLIGYNFGNHEGHVETIWLIALAVLIALGLVLFAIRPELSQVRTVTAFNQPVGYQEKDWTELQRTMTGPYAELSDGQLRALNVEPEAFRASQQGRHEVREFNEVIAAPEIPNERETIRVADTDVR